MLAAIVCGALITNVLVKNLVARPRPFADEARAFYDWWQYIGAPHASKNSFPSGHTSASFAAAVVLILNRWRGRWVALVLAVLIAFSRLYLYVHFPTDVLGGALVGAFCAWLSVTLWKKWIGRVKPFSLLSQRR